MTTVSDLVTILPGGKRNQESNSNHSFTHFVINLQLSIGNISEFHLRFERNIWYFHIVFNRDLSKHLNILDVHLKSI